MLLSAILLGLAICAAWLPPFRLPDGPSIHPWIVVFCAATGSALATGVVDWRGLLAILVFSGLAYASQRDPASTARRIATIATVAFAFALGLRLVPGFGNSVFLDGVQLSPDSALMRLTVQFDPGMAGLFLLALFCRRVHSWQELRSIIRPVAFFVIVTTTVVMALGIAVGYVRLDPKLPWFTAAHLAKILLFTVVVEEGFFRGVIQERLTSSHFITSRPHLRWLPVVASSLLFGIAHTSGGLLFVVLATTAGFGYALAYDRTRRIEAAITVHFCLNAVHFVGFTYPRLIHAVPH